MGFTYTFTTIQDFSQIDMLIDFMAKQNLDYPNYDKWLNKTKKEIVAGDKEAILAFNEGRLIGNLVHQISRDEGLGKIREIKNLRVHQDFRERGIANFMLKQLYNDCAGKYYGLILDVRAEQTETYNFLIGQGFSPIIGLPLYEKNREEKVMFKPLDKDLEGLIPRLKKIITGRSF